ncbi:hypothetical protein DAPPUDRAFT_319444 [Daphnia pulex]|uniref:Phosphatidic acid phosphatase type 2/haloperoxidase domain-containing protein n=1 Tax=Daphnia pulex TaxID=6669 RepID=E9GLR7_DAPPU|nr:hypothetical protein DAPPUDRAFT_319444 [Daphnia pulex]|eukprot:EFX79639.1 hypothetical protein DAPPUDRAFT_319444 [Daphnia pulex]
MRSKNNSKRKTDVNAKKRNLKSQKESVGTGGRLQNLLDWDVEWSNRFASFMQSKLPGVTAMFENKFMEISGNEYIWFPALAVLYFMHPLVHKQLPMNAILALAFDSAVILIIKAFVRRKRPPTRNPDYFTAIGPDQYSFPSGHASRTVLISFIFTQINPLFGNGYLNFVVSLLIWSWSISVCFSRMLNGRHHLLDVVTGAVIGFVEGSLVISALWMSSEKAENISKFIYNDQDN